MHVDNCKMEKDAGNYSYGEAGNLIFLSGKGPNKPDGDYITGKLGADLTIEEGYEAGRLTGVSQLSVLKTDNLFIRHESNT